MVDMLIIKQHLDNQTILGLIDYTIKLRNDFIFDICLFILNKIDMIQENIDYEMLITNSQK